MSAIRFIESMPAISSIPCIRGDGDGCADWVGVEEMSVCATTNGQMSNAAMVNAVSRNNFVFML